MGSASQQILVTNSSTSGIPVGAVIEFDNLSSNTWRMLADTGVTIHQAGNPTALSSSFNVTANSFGRLRAIQISLNQWDMIDVTPDVLARTVSGPLTSIASAATTAIANTTSLSHNVQITGTYTITAFGSAGTDINFPIYLLTFTGGSTLTHNATSLILPGGVNILTGAGDSATAIYLGSGNWQVVNYLGNTSTAVYSSIVKTPQTTISNTTLTAITGLSSITFATGGTYQIRVNILVTGAAAGMGYKIALGTSLGFSVYPMLGINTVSGASSLCVLVAGGVIVGATVATTSADVVSVEGIVNVIGGATFPLQFAQNSSTASNLTIQPGSSIVATRIA
jgi:hypothetical protein